MSKRISHGDCHPDLIKGLFTIEGSLKKSGMDLKFLELLKMRVSQMNECAFCLDMHYKEARDKGESEMRLYSVIAWRETPFFTEQERTALEFTEALTNANSQEIDDELYAKMAAHFSEKEIAYITFAVVAINSWNRVNKVFKTEPGNYVVGQFD